MRVEPPRILAKTLLLASCLNLAACAGGGQVLRTAEPESDPPCGSDKVLPAIVLLVNGMAHLGGGDAASSVGALELLTSDACRQAGSSALAFLAEVHMARRMIAAERGEQALSHLNRAMQRAQDAGYGPSVAHALHRLRSEAFETLGDTFRAAAELEDDPWLDRLIESREKR